MSKSLVSAKVIKFLAGGIVAAAVNLILVHYLVEKMGFNTPLLRNVANLLSIEAGIIVSFFIYRLWVWKSQEFSLVKILFQQLPLYHLAGGSALIARVFLVFPLLDWLSVNYLLNTFMGMLVGTAINYTISDRIVFKMPSR